MISVNPYDIVTRKAFVREFWRVLAAWRREDQTVSRRQVFDHLNGIYYDNFDEFAFPSYNAFRHSREFLGRDQD